VTFGSPDLTTPPTAGSATSLTLPVAKEAQALLPSKLMIGTRWDRLEGSPDGSATSNDTAAAGGPGASAPPSGVSGNLPSASAAPSAVANPSPSSAPTTSGTPVASGAPTTSGEPGASGAPTSPESAPAANPPDLVLPEVPGEVVAPRRATHLKTGGYRVPVRVPTEPGLYRLVATVHDADGLAYDAATQALIPALVVRVTGTSTASWSVAATANATAGRSFTIPVSVSNLGSQAWGHRAEAPGPGGGAAELLPASRAVVTASWVPLSAIGANAAGTSGSAVLPAGLAPGKTASVQFVLTAPAARGAYLLVFDVVDPDVGSLAALGVPPGIVRVTVGS
jgi:hypothetical protein